MKSIAKFDQDEVDAIFALAHKLTGTNVNAKDHSVIVQNIVTRMREVGCFSLEEYLIKINSDKVELSFAISALTVHTTSWWREAQAFRQLELKAEEYAQNPEKQSTPFRVLSMACSTGEEVYSSAGVLAAVAKKFPGFSYMVEGWDIDPISLKTAREGVYRDTNVSVVPTIYRELIGNSNPINKEFKVSQDIKSNVRFRAVNAINQPKDTQGGYDVIFCRNMLIYFTTEKISQIVLDLIEKMNGEGVLIVGLSETGAVNRPELKSSSPGVYCKRFSSQAEKIGESVEEKNQAPKNKTILIVEDEPDLNGVMVEELKDRGYDCWGVGNGAAAMRELEQNEFDLIVSDQMMPEGMTGLDLCKKVRAKGYRGKFVVISGFADTTLVNELGPAGGDEVVMKPCAGDDLFKICKSYIGLPNPILTKKPELVVLGASTGGTEVLTAILANMPSYCPPVLVVQHIKGNFAKDFAERLANTARLKIGEMKNDEILKSGHLYAALGDYHIAVRRTHAGPKLIISDTPPVEGHRPSVDYLFQSVAVADYNVVAALLTGMGRDGAKGLLAIRSKGNETIAQDELSSTVFGMPKEAIKLGAAFRVLNPQEIRVAIQNRIAK